MQVNVIAAVAKNRAIGYKNKLIYWLPNDLKRFKSLTVGNTVIMGKNTFLSLPKGALPNRRNIVLSRTIKHFNGCDTFTSLKEALNNCDKSDVVYIIGGETLYKEALSIADKLLLTEIDDLPKNADAFFPEYNSWKLKKEEKHNIDDKHKFAYAFRDYEK